MLSINNIITIPESWFLFLQSLINLNLTDLVGINHGPLPFFGINQIISILLLYLYFVYLHQILRVYFMIIFHLLQNSDEERLEIFKVYWRPNIYWSILEFVFIYLHSQEFK